MLPVAPGVFSRGQAAASPAMCQDDMGGSLNYWPLDGGNSLTINKVVYQIQSSFNFYKYERSIQ